MGPKEDALTCMIPAFTRVYLLQKTNHKYNVVLIHSKYKCYKCIEEQCINCGELSRTA